jgi:hypothetical protein
VTAEEQFQAGRDTFASYWESRGKAPWSDSLDHAFAEGVVDEFVSKWSGAGLAAEALEGGRKKAAEKHVEPLDALLELLQNADDQHAKHATLLLRRNELLFVHDGDRIQLPHVPAIVMPYLSTKRRDAGSLGRFGIGLKTLGALGDHLEVHGPPYHFSANDDGPGRAKPRPPIPGVYETDGRHTLFVLRLHRNALTPGELLAWIDELGTAGIVFLSELHELTVRTDEGMSVLKAGRSATADRGSPANPFEASHVTGGGGWEVYTRTVSPPADLTPKDKAREDEVQVGVALSNVAEGGRICIGLPIERRTATPLSIHAPFDPDDSRRDLLHTHWNDWLFDQLAELLADVVVIRYLEDPRRAWRGIPLTAELQTGHGWLDGQLVKLQHAAVAALAGCRFQPPDENEDETDFTNCAFEPDWLDGLVAPQLLTVRLADIVPSGHRDFGARWRQVLRDGKLGQQLEPREILLLADLDDEVADLHPTWWARLAAAYLARARTGDLETARVLVLSDGSRVSPRDVDAGLILTRAEAAAPIPVLARLHPDYLPQPGADRLVSWLEESGRLSDAPSDRRLLEALAAWSGDPLPLDDDALVWLHRVLWSLEARKRESLGREIGMRITFDGFVYSADGKNDRQVVPGTAYLPSSITHQADSFAKAAAATPGLNWLAPRYDKTLQASSDDGRGGALATMRLLGAMTAPQLTERSSSRWDRYSGRPAYRLDPGAGELQRSAVAEIGGRTQALRGDWGCEDLVRVAEDIAEDGDDGRKGRARALFATLCREWETEYDRGLEATAVHGHYGWNALGRVPTTWRSKLAERRWLTGPDGLAAPRILFLRTPALEAAHGEELGYAHEPDSSDVRAEVVARALGMETRPSASGLVEELKSLRDRSDDFPARAVATRARQLLNSLALLCPPLDTESVSVDEAVDDLTIRQLRAAFGIARDRPGLIFADGRWWARTASVLGAADFGRFRTSVSDRPPVNRLWRVLGITKPTLDDCVSALEDMSSVPLSDDDAGTYIAVLRLAADLVSQGEESRRLLTAPLWCGSTWVTDRPIIAVRDPAIATALRDHRTVWDPRCDLDTLGPLPSALGADQITPAELTLKAPEQSAERQGELYASKFRRAALLYRETCATDAHEIYTAMHDQWDELADATLVISPDLTVETRLATGTIDIAIEAFSARAPALVAVRHEGLLQSRELGRSIAAVWLRNSDGATPDQVKAALLWREASQQADAGLVPSGLELPVPAADRDLEELATDLRGRDLPPPRSRDPKVRLATRHGPEPVVVRLKSPDSVRPEDPVVRSRTSPAEETRGADRPWPRLQDAREIVTTGKPRSSTPRTPRATDRDPEDVAMGLLTHALRSDRLRDFRNQRGIGADAIDDMLGFIEMKHSRDGIPAKVSLTSAEFERAKELRERFVLALVTGLEQGTKSTVRLYPDPLSSLRIDAPSGVTVSGLNESLCIEIPLIDLDDGES